jgi:hypothetical protein
MLGFMSRPYNVVNWTFWLAILLVAGWAWCRSLRNGGRPGLLTTTLVSVLSLVVVLVALRLVYVAPFAIIQDVVAAKQILKGEPLPSTEIQPLVRQALASEPRPATLESVWPWLARVCPGLPEQEQQEYDDIATVIQVQAHPPFASLCAVPPVYCLGIYKTSVGLSLLSIVCVCVTLLLLYRGLRLNLPVSQRVLFCSVALGWYPMFLGLRSGQLGALLSCLIVAGWYSIRRGRPLLAGVAIGVAASLKLFPALLLVYFLLRHRRAFWVGLATIIIANTATMAVFGLHAYLDYMNTARVVVETWGRDHDNWSLLAALHHFADALGIPALSARGVFPAAALLFVAGLCLLVLAVHPSSSRTDFEYSLFVVAMTLLSPTCWSHYFVLLLLPLTVLANHALRERGLSPLLLLGLFLVVALPHSYHRVVLPFLMPYSGPRAGMALLFLPPLALLGLLLWLATLARTSSSAREDAIGNQRDHNALTLTSAT